MFDHSDTPLQPACTPMVHEVVRRRRAGRFLRRLSGAPPFALVPDPAFGQLAGERASGRELLVSAGGRELIVSVGGLELLVTVGVRFVVHELAAAQPRGHSGNQAHRRGEDEHAGPIFTRSASSVAERSGVSGRSSSCSRAALKCSR